MKYSFHKLTECLPKLESISEIASQYIVDILLQEEDFEDSSIHCKANTAISYANLSSRGLPGTGMGVEKSVLPTNGKFKNQF